MPDFELKIQEMICVYESCSRLLLQYIILATRENRDKTIYAYKVTTYAHLLYLNLSALRTKQTPNSKI